MATQMTYLLDTDSASLASERHKRVLSRIQQVPTANIWLSSIVAEESLRGTLNVISRNRDKPGLPGAYDFLGRLLRFIGQYPILTYDDYAAQILASFSPSVKRVGSQDCRIAARVVSRCWIVVTANQKDFSRRPGIQFEDWSR